MVAIEALVIRPVAWALRYVADLGHVHGGGRLVQLAATRWLRLGEAPGAG